jgi:hypothetical protein
MEKAEEMELALAEPFPESDIEWRLSRAGFKGDGDIYAVVLAYVTNRAIFKRLDNVCGLFGWQNAFKELESGGLLCGISIKFENEWITKWDGADRTQVEPVKGMISGAGKRAGVPWGIGRYLYNLPVTLATITDNRKDNYGKFKDNKKQEHAFFWKTPKMPKEFLP